MGHSTVFGTDHLKLSGIFLENFKNNLNSAWAHWELTDLVDSITNKGILFTNGWNGHAVLTRALIRRAVKRAGPSKKV